MEGPIESRNQLGGFARGAINRGLLPWPVFDRSIPPRLPIGGLVVAGTIWLGIVMLAQPYGGTWGTGQEAISYWGPRLAHPYAQANWTTTGAYVYSPAFLQLLSPLRALPWVAFFAVWTAMLLLAVRFLTGPRLFVIGAVLAMAEIAGGNISLLLAVAIVVGFRWPAAWALILLTKVTPGIGLLWFAVRKEWRNLGIALGATAVVIAVSAAIMPGAWAEWVSVLRPDRRSDATAGGGPDPVPRPPAGRGRGRRLGRPDGSALDGAGRLHAGPAGALVRRPDDAPGDHRPDRPDAEPAGLAGARDPGRRRHRDVR